MNGVAQLNVRLLEPDTVHRTAGVFGASPLECLYSTPWGVPCQPLFSKNFWGQFFLFFFDKVTETIYTREKIFSEKTRKKYFFGACCTTAPRQDSTAPGLTEGQRTEYTRGDVVLKTA